MTNQTHSLTRYSTGAIALHWLIALLIALNYAAAWTLDSLSKPDAAVVLGRHKAIGLAILALTLVRIAWRLAHRPPPLAESLKAWEVALSKVVHVLLYTLMLALPLSGWIMHSAASGGMPVPFFGLFDLPGLPLAHDKATAGAFHNAHALISDLMIALLVLHVGGALKHRLIDRDPRAIARMLPWGNA